MTPENSNYCVQIKRYVKIVGRYCKLQGWFPSSAQKFTFRNISWKWNTTDTRKSVLPLQKEPPITRIFPIYFSITEHIHDLCEMQLAEFFSSANPWNSHNFNI